MSKRAAGVRVIVRGKPVRNAWNWWAPYRGARFPFPLYVSTACIDLPIAGDNHPDGILIECTGRDAETIGGVWLGPCKPPKGAKP